jgi:two-component system cell cycle response regulator
MTGVILVVDDVPANVKLLEAKLAAEYYDVITAKDGFEAIEQTQTHKPDLILLDVMMPGMDGFETCKKIKEDPEIAHIPIVMVTALSELSDRLQGLDAGADDFITKPINDTALFGRVKSLVRIKVLIDELRLRDQSGAQLGIINEIVQGGLDVTGANIVLVDDDAVQCKRIKESLSAEHHVFIYNDHHEALEAVKQTPPDLIMISTMLMDIDGLRLATQFKAIDSLRHVPIITLVDEGDTSLMLKALELGVNDYLVSPIEASEMLARVRTQLRRKNYQDSLKSNYKESVSMAITDKLTGLYNRHYLDTHVKNLTESALENGKQMSLVIMDMDHFKHVNDTYGHDVGDEVLIQLAKIIVDATRSSDLVARFGGEEFVVLMPETDFANAWDVADRMRASIEKTPFAVSHEIGTLTKTMSIGVATLNHHGDSAEAMLKRADNALYVAKNGGRNQVQPLRDDEASATGGGSAAASPAPLTMNEPLAPLATAPSPQMPVPPLAPAPMPIKDMQPPQMPVQPASQPQPQPIAPPIAASHAPQAPPAPPPAQPAPTAPMPLAPMGQPLPLPDTAPIAQPPAPPPMQQLIQPPPAEMPVAQPQNHAPIPAPLQPMQPAAPPMAPAPSFTAPPAAQAPALRIPPPAEYHPNLAEAQKTTAIGAGPNNVSLNPAAQHTVIKPSAPEHIKPSQPRSYKSPIDDEPEGTF